MGSLNSNGQPISQNSIVSKNLGHRIHLSTIENDTLATVREFSESMMLHLDASDEGSFIKDSSQRISIWKDKSKYHRDFIQMALSRQPIWNSNSTNSFRTVYKDGSNIGTSSVLKTPTNNFDVLSVGIDRKSTLSHPFGGIIREIIVFNYNLGDFERIAIERYLMKKWGIV